MSQDCARSGITFIFASRPTRLEKISPSTCSEYASAPIRGSKFVGAESSKKVTVEESAEVCDDPQPPSRIAAHSITATTALGAEGTVPVRKILARVAVHQFPQNRPTLGARSRRQIIHPALKCLVSQHRKSQRFLRLRRHSKSRRWHDLNPWQSRTQLRHQQRILRPPARHN